MIESKRLKLAPIGEEHATDLYKLWSDFEVIKYTYMPLVKSHEECADIIRMFIERNQKSEAPQNFAILYNDTAIGICGFPIVESEKGAYGFYYQLCRDFWGTGLGFEAAEALLEHITRNTSAACVYADAVSVNPASLSILTRLGFQQTHIQPKEFTRNHLVLDLIHFKYLL